jgi:hypothetical protein
VFLMLCNSQRMQEVKAVEELERLVSLAEGGTDDGEKVLRTLRISRATHTPTRGDACLLLEPETTSTLVGNPNLNPLCLNLVCLDLY